MMIKFTYYSTCFGAAIALALLISGCGHSNGSSAGSGSVSVGATPSLGLVRNATVNFYQADGSTLLGTGDTGADGSVTVSFSADSYNGPVIVEVQGDDDAEYFDEATGMFEAFGSGDSLFAMAPSTGGTVAVTPLTDLAYRAAVRNNLLPLSASEVSALNKVVADALAGGIDILIPPALLDTAMSADLPADDSGRYALVLATLAYLGADGTNDPVDATPPALAVLRALAADLADGVIDNVPAGTAYTDFDSEFTAAIINAAAAYAGSDLNDEVSNTDQDYETPDKDLGALDGVANDDSDGGDNPDDGNGDTTVSAAGLQDLGNNSGITGTFSGNNRQTYTVGVIAAETVGGLINISSFGTLPTNRWEITVRNQTGVQRCNVDDPIIQFSTATITGSSFESNAFTTANGKGTCMIELTKVAQPGAAEDIVIEGVFVGTLGAGVSNTDTASRNVTRGAFRGPVTFK